MSASLQTRAEWRALISAAVIGSGIGLGLGAAYLMGGMARATVDHARASRIAAAAEGGYSDVILRREAGAMDPVVLRLAAAYDPAATASFEDEGVDTASFIGLPDANSSSPINRRLVLRAAFGAPYAPSAFGALQSSRELECLTQAVYFEARGEGAAGQAAVAQVVLNRVKSPVFPKTICGVVFQGAARRAGCQFSFACDGSMRRHREPNAWARAERIAARAMSGAVMAAVGSATHFHTTGVAPEWGPHLLRVAQVGDHVFYKFGRRAPPHTYSADGKIVAPDPAPADYRLASAVITEAPADAPPGLGGPLQAGPEPASAPPEAADASKAARLTPTASRDPAVKPSASSASE